MPETSPFFSPSWKEARARFRAATAHLSHGALPVPVEAPTERDILGASVPNGDLTIDWAFHGDPDAQDLILVTSGLHGIEGFPGSAIQLAMLAKPARASLLLLHVLNPWGMGNLRRVNGNNVDLNRNFLAPGEIYQGAESGYRELNALLNPTTPPGLDFFWPRAASILLRRGFQTLKSAVACGQYEFPKGLFFGGKAAEPEPTVLLPFLDEQLSGRRRVVHVDLHSAIGQRGGRTLLLDAIPKDASAEESTAQVARAKAAFGEVRTWDASDPSGYPIRGGLTGELRRRYPKVRYDGLTCEFGTVSTLAVLGALREENRLQHYGKPHLDAPEKQAMFGAFAPLEDVWQERVLAHATPIYDAANVMVATG